MGGQKISGFALFSGKRPLCGVWKGPESVKANGLVGTNDYRKDRSRDHLVGGGLAYH